MNCPLEMAESFLRKWKDEQTVLVVNLLGYGFSSTLGATVSEFDINEAVVFAALAGAIAVGRRESGFVRSLLQAATDSSVATAA